MANAIYGVVWIYGSGGAEYLRFDTKEQALSKATEIRGRCQTGDAVRVFAPDGEVIFIFEPHNGSKRPN